VWGGHRKIDVAAKKTPSKEDLRQLGGDAEEGGVAGWEAPRRRGSEAAAAAAAAVGRCAWCRCCLAEVSLLLLGCLWPLLCCGCVASLVGVSVFPLSRWELQLTTKNRPSFDQRTGKPHGVAVITESAALPQHRSWH
jgi:hypothetical protein